MNSVSGLRSRLWCCCCSVFRPPTARYRANVPTRLKFIRCIIYEVRRESARAHTNTHSKICGNSPGDFVVFDIEFPDLQQHYILVLVCAICCTVCCVHKFPMLLCMCHRDSGRLVNERKDVMRAPENRHNGINIIRQFLDIFIRTFFFFAIDRR